MLESVFRILVKWCQANGDEGGRWGIKVKRCRRMTEELGGVWNPPKLAALICEQPLNLNPSMTWVNAIGVRKGTQR